MEIKELLPLKVYSFTLKLPYFSLEIILFKFLVTVELQWLEH